MFPSLFNALPVVRLTKNFVKMFSNEYIFRFARKKKLKCFQKSPISEGTAPLESIINYRKTKSMRKISKRTK